MKSIEYIHGVAVIRLSDKVCADTHAGFLALIDQAVTQPNALVAVDLTACVHVDSSGLSSLLAAQRRVAEAGGRIVLFGANRLVREIFDRVQLNSVLPIARTQQDAMAKLADSAANDQ